MKFHEFLQSKYMEAQQKVKEEYSVIKHAELLATEDLRNAQRYIVKLVQYFLLPIKFVLIKLKLIKPPKSMEQHIEDMKAQMIKDEAPKA